MNKDVPLLQRICRVERELGSCFKERFALVPLVDAAHGRDVAEALRDGKVPVVVSDAMELPLADAVDYSSVLFRVGTCASELELLHMISALPDDEVDAMRARGRLLYERCFVGSSFDFSPCLDAVDFPARLPSGRIVRESEWMRFFWRSLTGRVLIFGAGKYFQRLMEATGGGQHGPEVVGVLDDSVAEPAVIHGVTLAPGSFFKRGDFDAVFLATDSMEGRFAARVRELFGADVPLLKPSELMLNLPLEAGDDEEPYVAPERIAPARYPSKLEGVVVSVGCGDFLSWSLPQNVKHFDRFVVVTSPEDELTQRVAKTCSAELVISERFREDGAVFNKGKMLNDGFAALDLDGWVLVTDADIVFRKGMRRRLMSRLLNENSLYYATRFNTPEEGREAWLSRWFENPGRFADLTFCDLASNQMPWGYFQLFYGLNTQPYSEAYDSAGDVDYEFQARWPVSHRVLLPEGVVHIAHGELGKNWQGRVSDPLRVRY